MLPSGGRRLVIRQRPLIGIAFGVDEPSRPGDAEGARGPVERWESPSASAFTNASWRVQQAMNASLRSPTIRPPWGLLATLKNRRAMSASAPPGRRTPRGADPLIRGHDRVGCRDIGREAVHGDGPEIDGPASRVGPCRVHGEFHDGPGVGQQPRRSGGAVVVRARWSPRPDAGGVAMVKKRTRPLGPGSDPCRA
jgi:hypothetical protein